MPLFVSKIQSLFYRAFSHRSTISRWYHIADQRTPNFIKSASALLFTTLSSTMLCQKMPKLSGPYQTTGLTTFHIKQTDDQSTDDHTNAQSNEDHSRQLELVVRVFYPSSKSKPTASLASGPSYMTVEQAAGLASFAGIPSFLFTPAASIKIRATVDAPIAETDEKLPIILYSHGLGGIPETYQVQANDLASQGFVVFMLTHNDRSASLSVLPDGRQITYERPSGSETAFRSKQLEHRVDELLFLLDSVSSGKSLPTSQPIQHLHERIDTDKVTFIGHSFGGATVMAAASYEQKLREEKGLKSRVKCVVSHDQWMLPVHSKIKNLSLRTPVLITISEGFKKWDSNYQALRSLYHSLDKQSNSLMCYIRGTKHSNFSDVGLYGPAWLLKKMGQVGELDVLYVWQMIDRLNLAWACKHCDIKRDALPIDVLDAEHKPAELVWVQ